MGSSLLCVGFSLVGVSGGYSLVAMCRLLFSGASLYGGFSFWGLLFTGASHYGGFSLWGFSFQGPVGCLFISAMQIFSIVF